MTPLAPFPHPDPPRDDQFMPCIKCGLCLSVCPTYQETGLELESPRGRVQLIASVARGVVPLSAPKVEETLFSCLDCRACEVACPSGVPIGSLIEAGRGQVAANSVQVKRRRLSAALVWVVARRRLLEGIGRGLYWAQRLGLTRLAGALPGLIGRMGPAAPQVGSRSGRRRIGRGHAGRDGGPRTALFLGCVMDVMFGDANEAAARVLERHGCAVGVPSDQGCCGALAIHAGDRQTAKNLARRNIDAFLAGDAQYVVTTAGGCGAALMEYPEWLADDPAYRERAREFADKVRDVTQVLAAVGFVPPTGRVEATVTYQASCHLHNVMNVGDLPQRLLQQIPGIAFKPLPDAARCCGSAGIYNLTHPAMADALLARKMADVPVPVDVIATGNPGCWIQMAYGVERYGPPARVMHTVQLLDAAYRAEEARQAEK